MCPAFSELRITYFVYSFKYSRAVCMPLRSPRPMELTSGWFPLDEFSVTSLCVEAMEHFYDVGCTLPVKLLSRRKGFSFLYGSHLIFHLIQVNFKNNWDNNSHSLNCWPDLLFIRKSSNTLETFAHLLSLVVILLSY